MDMQTPPLKSDHIYMQNAQYAETNEKSTFRFLLLLFFELWSILSAYPSSHLPICSLFLFASLLIYLTLLTCLSVPISYLPPSPNSSRSSRSPPSLPASPPNRRLPPVLPGPKDVRTLGNYFFPLSKSCKFK